MWPYKLARIALLFVGTAGLVEYGRYAKERPDERQFVERESVDFVGGDTGSLLPDLMGGRVPIPGLPPPAHPGPSHAVVDRRPEQDAGQPPVMAGSFARLEPQPADSPVAPSRRLALNEMKTWNSGRDIFDRKWTELDGLGGPGFNAESCGTCHNAPCTGGAGGNEFNVVHMPGSQRYGGIARSGNQLTRMRKLRKRLNARSNRRFTFAEVQTPSLLGLGAIDTIPDSEILSREDPNDYDGDGVRGVARRLAVNGVEEIGRFGWKARTPRLSDFVCLALGGELGLTIPRIGASGGERGFGLLTDRDPVEDPEIPLAEFEALVFFVAHMAPPERGGSSDMYDVNVGRNAFDRIGCSTCHVPALMGRDGPVNLYSDLLLHEMQVAPELCASLSDLRGNAGELPEPTAFRTPPLWGVGKTAPYMHDGRSTTLRAAILAHAGEGAASRDRFKDMEEADQLAMIAFLEDL